VKKEGVEKIPILLQQYKTLVERTQAVISDLLNEPMLNMDRLVSRTEERLADL